MQRAWLWGGLGLGSLLLLFYLTAPVRPSETMEVAAAPEPRTARPDFGSEVRRSVLPAPMPRALADPELAQVMIEVFSVSGPLGGATVTLDRGNEGHSGTTDAEGRAAFSDLEPGRWRLRSVIRKGYQPSPPTELRLERGERVRRRVGLRPLARLYGYVGCLSGEPAPSAELSVVDTSGDIQRLTADGRGRFQLQATRGARISARHDRCGMGEVIVGDGALARGRIGLRLRPEALEAFDGALIRGVVKTDGGAPVAAARVGAYPDHGAPHTAVTNESGRFELAVRADLIYSVRAVAEDGRRARQDAVVAGTADLVLELRGGGRVEGEVVGADGAPVEAFTLRWASAESRGQRSFLGTDGRFEVDNLPAGEYIIEAESGPLGSAQARGVDVSEGGRAYAALRLEALGVIEGVLLDEETGAPLAGGYIYLESRPGLGRPPQTRAAGDGTFRLEGVTPGRRSLGASAEGHRSRIVSALDVRSGEVLGPITMGLAPTDGDEQAGGGFDLVGIGAVMARDGDALVIRRVVPGGGASEAGLTPGTRVVGVDGQTVRDMGYDGTIQAIRGQEGTTVQLSIVVDGTAQVVAILRRRIAT